MNGKKSRQRTARPEAVGEDSLQTIYDAKKAWHHEQARLPLREKVRILLELQRQDLELLKRHRPLKWWERPWEIEP